LAHRHGITAAFWTSVWGAAFFRLYFLEINPMRTFESNFAGLPIDRGHIRRNLYWRNPRKVSRLEQAECN
jgi:hypothetical protein